MRALYCSSHTFPSWLVRFFTWSRWSHCAVQFTAEDGTEHVLEAVWPRVREVSLEVFMADNDIVKAVSYPCHDPAAAIAWGRTQIGHPYNLPGALGLPFHEVLGRRGWWLCSRYMAAMYGSGHSDLIRPSEIAQATPQALWQMPGLDL